jgi:hypothetical protein
MLLWVASRVRLATQRPVASGQRDSSYSYPADAIAAMPDTIAGGPGSTPTCRTCQMGLALFVSAGHNCVLHLKITANES